MRSLVRRGWPRSAAAGLVDLGLLTLLVRGCGALIGWGVAAVSDFAQQVPALMTGLAQALGHLEERVRSLIAQAPAELENTLRLALDAVGESLYGLPALLSQWALDAVGKLAGKSPDCCSLWSPPGSAAISAPPPSPGCWPFSPPRCRRAGKSGWRAWGGT